jgi:N-dimethylarginine dimethylaminohydrolase
MSVPPSPTLGAAPSRVIHVSATQAEVSASCRQQDALVSAIEVLVSGGTRVVLTNMEGAEKMRRVFGPKVITGEVRRAPHRMLGR